MRTNPSRHGFGGRASVVFAFFLLAFALAFGAGCDCGASNAGAGHDDLSAGDDDDAGGDDDGGLSDDDASDDPDTDFDPLTCALPDPEGVAPNLIAGGEIDGEIRAWAFDHATCMPLAGVDILNGGQTYTTDEDGFASVPAGGSVQFVTARMDGCRAWTYLADARVMYFRLLCGEPETDDASEGSFLLGGTPIGAANVTGGDYLASEPLAFGFAWPGVSRQELLLPPPALYADETFALTFGATSYDLPRNIFLPALGATAGANAIIGSNDAFVVPLIETNALAGFAAEVNFSDVYDASELSDIVTAFATNDPGGALDAALANASALWGAVHATHVGIAPERDVATASLRVRAADRIVTVIAENAGGAAHIAAVFAEVPNRAFVPMGIGVLDADGRAALLTADVPDADFIVALARTDSLTADFDTLNASVILTTREDISNFGSAVQFDADDLLPLFDAGATGLDVASGVVTFELDGFEQGVDVYLVHHEAQNPACPVYDIIVPASEPQITIPEAVCPHASLSANDLVVVFAIDLPEEIAVDLMDPTALFAERDLRFVVWANRGLASLL
ncbi:hypothetical protein K8I61_18285 [bacterium]|nr:hypothetical protein [bacterium]